jgi:hypothetical protein
MDFPATARVRTAQAQVLIGAAQSHRSTRTVAPTASASPGGRLNNPFAAAREASVWDACRPAEKTFPASSTRTRMK